MNVHLIRSEEFNVESYWDVLNLLQQFPGPINFIPSEEPISPEDIDSVTWDDEISYGKKERPKLSKIYCESDASEFPKKINFISQESLFNLCDEYRIKNDIGDEEIVYILTDIINTERWFANFSENNLNGFVHTADWDYFFPGNDRRFPICYEISVLILQQLTFENQNELMKHVHYNPIGCMMDFCEEKKQVKYKMRTADICINCLDHLQKNISNNISLQSLEIMEGVRSNMLYKTRYQLNHEPSKLEIRGNQKKIFLTELGDLEIRLSPQEKTIYLLFLEHKDGLLINHLPDHEQEALSFYSSLSNNMTIEEDIASIKKLIDPHENNVSEKISRIKSKFNDAIGENMAKHYIIEGPNAGLKKISLNRNLVTIKN